ncbi:hypothetical protein [Halalkalicoccus tibetensis]|uniref:Uncharacterized protein n=1 Tax=Halalkalicoccus tibetensis TaxID=175632 RepID=A0ABD5V0N0_9EURY
MADTVFEWLFPGWQNPAALAAIVGLRALCNGSLVVLLVRSLGIRHPFTTIAAGLAVFSTALTVLLLRPGGPGLYASYVELAGQALLLALAGAGLSLRSSARRTALGGVLIVGALSISALMIPIYGEAFVAP